MRRLGGLPGQREINREREYPFPFGQIAETRPGPTLRNRILVLVEIKRGIGSEDTETKIDGQQIRCRFVPVFAAWGLIGNVAQFIMRKLMRQSGTQLHRILDRSRIVGDDRFVARKRKGSGGEL